MKPSTNHNKKKPLLSAPRGRRQRPTLSRSVQEGEEAMTLLQYLTDVFLKDRSRTTVKQLLSDRFVSVSGVCTTQHDHPLNPGDQVSLHPMPLPKHLSDKYIEILWQDDHLVMIHKAVGIPTVSSGEERDKTAMQIVSAHLKKFDPRAKVYLLNRVDKDSAGFVLMAKSPHMQELMTERWAECVERQTFALVVEGQISPSEGELDPPTDKQGKERASSSASKRAKTKRGDGWAEAGKASYKCISQTPHASLLIAELHSGRNNRLRKQLSALRHPILGDWRAGSERKDLGGVALEGIAFTFRHPLTGQRHDFSQPIPPKFRAWMRSVKL